VGAVQRAAWQAVKRPLLPRARSLPPRKKRSATKRDTVKVKNATFYAKRTASGQFKEMDEKRRSLKADRRTKAKRTVNSGHGDQGDRRRKAA
jgi:hypothetical protein